VKAKKKPAEEGEEEGMTIYPMDGLGEDKNNYNHRFCA
jgi:hypothetical protein